jgi:histidinol dehydrogenase
VHAAAQGRQRRSRGAARGATGAGRARVFKLGGAQAIAAMALGTGSMPRCDKLFGPGQQPWVDEAKRQAPSGRAGPAIDMPAGPSEVLVIADAGADPAFVAADLLSQAEHGPDSQVLLVSDNDALLDAVARRSRVAACPAAACRNRHAGVGGVAVDAGGRHRPGDRGQRCICTRAPDPGRA